MDFTNTVIGIELGSTRIKAVLLDKNHKVLASGDYTWENQFINHIWTYSLEDARKGLQECYKNLTDDVKNKYNSTITTVGAIGISGMMHGYLPFDKDFNQLCEFRTWRNTITSEAVKELNKEFNFNIPQRWSIAHLYQAILNKEEHLSKIDYFTTLCGYIHYLLTNQKILGIGEASGMFPIDSKTNNYDETMLNIFNQLITKHGYHFDIRNLLPKILVAGENAGYLTKEGALLLDPSGNLQPGIPFVPCEGDAGTGMVATNSVKEKTGNVSAGTSDFLMLVVDKKLKMHREIDMVTTPSGKPVAMVHCNNCTSDINAWVSLFDEVLKTFDKDVDKNTLYSTLFKKALEADKDCGGIISYNYYSGEGITDLDEGRLILLRKAESKFNLANFMRNNLLSALATLKIGLDILTKEEDIKVEKLYGHGGYFKTEKVGQLILSAAANSEISIMETAGEGGPYGMAILAAYSIWKEKNETLEDYLEKKVFANVKISTLKASKEDVEGFTKYLEAYKKALAVEKSAIENY